MDNRLRGGENEGVKLKVKTRPQIVRPQIVRPQIVWSGALPMTALKIPPRWLRAMKWGIVIAAVKNEYDIKKARNS